MVQPHPCLYESGKMPTSRQSLTSADVTSGHLQSQPWDPGTPAHPLHIRLHQETCHQVPMYERAAHSHMMKSAGSCGSWRKYTIQGDSLFGKCTKHLRIPSTCVFSKRHVIKYPCTKGENCPYSHGNVQNICTSHPHASLSRDMSPLTRRNPPPVVECMCLQSHPPASTVLRILERLLLVRFLSIVTLSLVEEMGNSAYGADGLSLMRLHLRLLETSQSPP